MQLHAALLLNFFFVNLLDEWIPIVRGNNTISLYVYFGAFAKKTGRTISYKNPLVDLLWRHLSRGSVSNPSGGAIYWYKVFVSGIHMIPSVITISLSYTSTCTSTGKELKLYTYSHAICVQSFPKDIQTLQSYYKAKTLLLGSTRGHTN